MIDHLFQSKPNQTKAFSNQSGVDRHGEREIEDIALLASQICGTPIAMVSLTDNSLLSARPEDAMETNDILYFITVCTEQITQDKTFVVEDTLSDPRLTCEPSVVVGSQIRFCAGTALIDSFGRNIGMLCASDTVPRKLSLTQRDAFQALGRQAGAQLERIGESHEPQRFITEQQQSEKSLRESEERFLQLADNIVDVFWITSPDMKIIHYVSPGYELIWGRSLKSLYLNPRQWADAVVSEDQDQVFAAFASLMENESNVSVEFRIKRPDGDIRWVHSRGFQVRNPSGDLVRIAGISADITIRKQNEETVRMLGLAVEQAKESIMITDSQLELPGPRILFVNPAFTRMTGYSADEAIGKTPRMLQGPNTEQSVLKHLKQKLSQGEVVEGETPNYRKDGSEFQLEWQIAPVRNTSETITHFVAIQRDVTQRKRVEAQMLQSQKLETVGKLAGGIAHEFNSIMTAIIGQSELILGDLPSGSPLVKNAAEIRTAADRAAILTRQLLAFGRQQILQPKALDLNAILLSSETVLRHVMGKNTEIRLVSNNHLKPVIVDAGQIEQVIVNLAMNAADGMPNGGKLTLETANIFLDQSYVSRFPDLEEGDYVMLAVTDTGMGMSTETKARIFEPFFSTKPTGQGTGLGLSTCYGILKQSGGHIAVYSEPGRGTTFKIYLPVVKQETEVYIRIEKPGSLPRGNETILLVEDDSSLRQMATTLLTRLGYNILPAADGIEALQLAQTQGRGHIDLLFTDIVMPYMSGKELSDRVQSLSSQTKILFASAYTGNAIAHQGLLDEGVMLLEKPFSPSALAHKIREAIDEG